ncbi:unnamed protein product [Closterium sp. NIES-54]
MLRDVQLILTHLPPAERAHFGQYKTAQSLYDTVVARYSSPATAALSRLMLPYLFPDLAASATVADLVAHLHTSDARYRAALPTEFCAKKPPPPPMYITLYYLVTRLLDSLSSVRDHFLSLCPTKLTVDLLEERLAAAEKSILAVGASRGDRRTPFFDGCSPVPLLPSVASAAAVDLVGTEKVGAAYASSWRRRTSKGKGSKGGGGGGGGSSGGGGGGGGGGGNGGGGTGSGGVSGGGGGRGGSGGGGGGSGSGGGGSGGGGAGRGAAAQRGGFGGSQREQQLRTCGTPSVQQLREWYSGHGRSGAFPDAVELPRWHDLLLQNVPIFDIDFGAILATMYALADSAEGGCYLSVPPDPGIAVAALGASASAAPGTSASAAPGAGAFAHSGTAPTESLHTFTLDSGASCSFFRDSTTLTPLSQPVAVSLADPSGGPVLAHSSTVLPCPAAPSGLLSGLHLPSFSTNLVSGADLQDTWVDQFTPGGQRVSHCTCSRTGHHLATFTRRPGSSLYTLTTAPPPVSVSGQVVASSQVFAAASRSSPASAPCSCRPLAHETLLWHHRLGHPSLPRLRGMASHTLVSGLPRSLPPLPLGPAPTCVPCVEGRQRAAPHSSSFPPTKAPLQTLQMDAWGPARVRGQSNERYFLLVVDDYSRYTTVFPLRSKGEVLEVLIDWIRGARRQLSESFGSDLPVLRLHSDRGGEFSSDLLRAFCRSEGIRQTFTLPASPQQNGIAERRIGMVMDVAHTSMIHADAPHFLWPYLDRHETGGAETGGAESGGTESRCAELWGAEPGRVEPEGAVSGGAEPARAAFGVALCGAAGATGGPAGAYGGAAGAGGVAGAAGGAAGAGGIAGASGGAAGAGAAGGAAGAGAAGGAAGAKAAGGAARTGDPGAEGTGSVSAVSGGAVRLRPYYVPLLQQVLGSPPSPGPPPPLLSPPPIQSLSRFQPASPLPGLSSYSGPTSGLTERCEPESRPASPVRPVGASRVSRPRPPPIPGTNSMNLRPSTAPQRVPLPSPPASSLPSGPDPASDSLRAASPAVTRFLATAVTDPLIESTAASALVAELVDFATACRIDYAASLVAESVSVSVCPPSVGGDCALGTDVLEDREEEFECFAASVPHLVSMLLAPEGDPNALDIPTPRSYAEAIEGPYSSQWQAAMDAEMASWKSTRTYVDEVPLAWGEHPCTRRSGCAAHLASLGRFLLVPSGASGGQSTVSFRHLGPAPSGVSQVDAVEPVEATGDSGAATGAEPGGAGCEGTEPGGAEPEGPESGGAEPGGAGTWGAEPGGTEPGGAEPGGVEPGGAATEGAPPGGALSRREPLSPQELREWFARRWRRTASTGGSSAAEGAAAAGPGVARPGSPRAAGPEGSFGAGPAEGAGAEPTTGGPASAAPRAAGGSGATGGAAGGSGAARGAAGGPAGAGSPAWGTVAVPAVPGVATRPRPYFVPLLQQVLGPPPPPPLESPPPVQSQPQPASPLPAPSPYAGPTGGLTERREPASRPASPVRTARASGRGSRQLPPPVPGTHRMSLRPSTAPLRAPLPSPPASSLPALADPESDSLRAASPTVARLLATAVTDPSFESSAASALVTELVDFPARCRLDYATSLVAESESACSPSVGGECALGTDVLEDRQEEFQCLAAASPHLASILLAPEGDPDALDIPTPRSYAEAIEGPYSSQWQAAMDAEMASWKSTGTYVDAVPPPGANIVSGMWIFRVKRPPGSPPVFKARYVACGFSQRQGVDYFQTFSPTPKMTTLRVLLHVAAHHDYELHSLDFSTAFLQGSLHEEIWLRRPPGFTGSFPPGTQWSLRRPVYGLREWHDTLRTTLAALGFAPSTADPSLFLRTDTSLLPFYILVEWHDTLRTTLAALGFAPSTSDPSLFLPTDTTLPPFYVLVYVDDLVFATADTETLAHVKSELQKRHTCTDLGELTSYLGLRITRDRAQHTITLIQSHMVQQVLQCLGFTYSSPQSTPLPTSHSLSAPPSDESVEPSGPYPELVGCLMHRKVHWDATKRVLRYLCSTSIMGLVLGGRARVVLTGHADASWVDDLATQRSSQGYTFSLGSGSVSWRSTRSSSILSSSCEAEIYAGAMAAQELCWLTYLVTDLGEAPRSPPVLYVDNKAMLALCREHRLEHRTKHIALRYFLARELQQCGQLRLAYGASRANTADVFTKALQPCDHQRFCTVLGLVPTVPHLLTS